jgi:hypothetical protein
MGMVVRVAVWLACLTIPAAAIGQTRSSSRVTIDVSNWRLRTSVSAAMAGGQLLHRGTDALFDRAAAETFSSHQRRGRFARGLKLLAVDLPIAAISHTLAHEAGHITRLNEDHIRHGRIQITQWPWPVPFMDAQTQIRSPFPMPDDPRVMTHAAAGGEAAVVRDRFLGDTIAATGGLDYFQSAQLIYSRLETPGAAWIHLADSTFDSEADFFGGKYGPTDSRVFVRTFEFVRRGRVSLDDFHTSATTVRRQSLLALADLQLWGAVTRVASYVLSGETAGPLPAIRVGSARLLPRATFGLTARGIARGGQALVLTPGAAFDVSVTSTLAPISHPEQPVTRDAADVASDRHLWDGHVRIMPTHSRLRIQHVDAVVWQQDTRGIGGSAEIGWAVPLPQTRATAGVSLGYKTRGYLAGAPDRAGWFLGASLTVK